MILKNIPFILIVIIFLCMCDEKACADNYTVIIVGAGPAGTAAASKLLENNINDILVLEAEPRPGGRIYSVKFGDGYVDLGAEFCHGRAGNLVYELAKDLNFLVQIEDKTEFFLSSGEAIKTELGNKLFEVMVDTYNMDVDDAVNSTAKDFYMSRYNETVSNLYKNDTAKLRIALQAGIVFEKYLQSSEGTFSLSNVAAKTDYKSVDDINLRWSGTGYKIILDILTKKYPDPTKALPFDEKLRLNKEVTKINWGADKVALETADGSRYTADHVIFTPSVGVLKHTHTTMFVPHLPQSKQDAIEDIGFDAIMTIHLHFTERWWPESEFTGASFVWDERDQEEFIKKFRNISKNDRVWLTGFYSINPILGNPNVLTGWLVGDLIPDIELMDDETVLNGLSVVLDKFLTKKYNVTKPDKIVRNNWYTNPHFRGTYSHQTLKVSQRDPSVEVILSQPLQNKENKSVLLFAGEATHPHHFSTVHGAIETGYREADRIIQLHQNEIKRE